jgi:predicted nucleic acid-binding protein
VGRRFYVDTSAYLAILLAEAGSRRLARELAGGELVTSALMVIEAYRNLVRLSRDGVLGAADFQAAVTRLEADRALFAVRDLTLDLCGPGVMPVVTTPRTLDLLHLRTAMWFHEREPLARFVSLDARQLQAARELGLPVR